MALGIPLVVGPINEWLDAIVVEGCLPGVTVIVQTDEAVPTVVAKGVAVGGRDFVPVTGTLKEGQRLVAFQSVPGDTSPSTPSASAVTVGAAPKDHKQLPAMAFVTTLYRCGRAIWLKGASPGAEVAVVVGGNPAQKVRAGSDGNARMRLNSPLTGPGTAVEATQAAPVGHPPLTGAPIAVSKSTLGSPLGKLPTPIVGNPSPLGCDSAVHVSGIVDGAEVTIERSSDGLRETATFDRDALWFNLSKPFPASGDKIVVSQAMPRCHEHPSDLLETIVAPAETPKSLAVTEPCAGSPFVHVENLRPGARISIAVPGRPVYENMVPPDKTVWDVPVDPLPENQTVTVTLALCTFTTSTTAAIKGKADPVEPTLIPDLYRCARAVSVNTTPGAQLEVWGDSGSGPTPLSLRVFAKSALCSVDVFPFLAAELPQKVWVKQLTCGGEWVEGPPLDVKDYPRLDFVELFDPLIEGATAVLPRNAIPGAHVTVWRSDANGGNQEVIGERDVSKASPTVGLNRPLRTDDIVWAVQEICKEATREGPRYEVWQGTKVFLLPAAKEQLSTSLNGKAIVHSAKLECRFRGGRWALSVDVENTEHEYDCGLVVGVDLKLPAPLTFGENVDVDLAADGGLPQGLASLGYASKKTATKNGTLAAMKNPAFWLEVLNATATWRMFATWRNYDAIAEQPENEEKEDKNKPDNH
ncbi:hypothetical protein SAMN05216345_107363 [Cupriavidus sp. YR651]|uniref:hypothetical protein n=1 Tax=Cupriavidus sp. YR651 TaxID=1855315 RepID=UPI000885D101|nr:hypothetical protein [Cupriavidus sp. YR651]SDD30530.1 hypothetical protein SAMN05216345_107363 [Cupriavidus sp. YR651]